MTLEQIQIDIILKAYERGLRSTTLGSQPTPWMVKGLQILESGQELTADVIRASSLSGGTDHPDPWC